MAETKDKNSPQIPPPEKPENKLSARQSLLPLDVGPAIAFRDAGTTAVSNGKVLIAKSKKSQRSNKEKNSNPADTGSATKEATTNVLEEKEKKTSAPTNANSVVVEDKDIVTRALEPQETVSEKPTSDAGLPKLTSDTPPPPLPSKEEVERRVQEAKKEIEQAKKSELPAMPEINSETVFDGATLRKIREARGMSIQNVYTITRIAKHWLECIEKDDYSKLPSRVYVRGYISTLARSYGLPTEQAVSTFMMLYDNFRGSGNTLE